MKLSVPKALREFIESQVRQGEFSTPNEYICSLIREDQNRNAVGRFEPLLLEGLASGVPIEVNQVFWEKKRSALNSRRPKTR
jgi:antitoxin ParD1/3/4